MSLLNLHTKGNAEVQGSSMVVVYHTPCFIICCRFVIPPREVNYSYAVGLIVVIKGQTGLPVWSYIIALMFGALITVCIKTIYVCYLRMIVWPCNYQPFAIILSARMGTGINTMPLMKMLAGAIHPGQPIANLYVGCLLG
jgi:hypothetical protein